MFLWFLGIAAFVGGAALVRALRTATTKVEPSLAAAGAAIAPKQTRSAIGVSSAPSSGGDAIPKGNLKTLPVLPLDQWATVEFGGHTFKVHPTYLGPARIGEAADLAKKNGWTLPSPALVDAIWRAADLKLMPNPQSPNKGMSASQAAKQAQAIADQIGDMSFTLLGGTHKDIVDVNGKHGIYGWHVADADIPAFIKKAGFDPRKIGGPDATPGPGQIIQGANTTSHDASYGDYSQGLRPIVQVS